LALIKIDDIVENIKVNNILIEQATREDIIQILKRDGKILNISVEKISLFQVIDLITRRDKTT
jgi:hypothetical protein